MPDAVCRTSVGSTTRAASSSRCVERLERLVREVDRVALIDEHVIGHGGEHHRLRVVDVRGVNECGLEHTFGGIRAAFDEPPVPLREPVDGYAVARERADGEVRRMSAVSFATAARPWISASARSSRSRCGMRFAIATSVVRPVPQPGVAVAHAELDAGPYDRARRDAGVEQPEHRLGDDERDVLLEPLAQPAMEMLDDIRVRPGRHPDVAGADLDVEAARVVRPQVERATGDEVEARVVPVAGHQPGLDRPLVEREAEMRTAVLDGVAGAVVPEHDHRQRADLGAELTGGLELGQRAGADLLDHAHILGAGCLREYLREAVLAIICFVMSAVKSEPSRTASWATPSAASSTA